MIDIRTRQGENPLGWQKRCAEIKNGTHHKGPCKELIHNLILDFDFLQILLAYLLQLQHCDLCTHFHHPPSQPP